MPRLANPPVLLLASALGMALAAHAPLVAGQAAPAGRTAQPATQPAAQPAQEKAQPRGPRSLLPDDLLPAPAPAPSPAPLPLPAPTAPAPGGEDRADRQIPALDEDPFGVFGAGSGDAPEEEEAGEEADDPMAALVGPLSQPENAGILSPASGGYRPDLFQGSDARFLATLLHRIDSPLASRWAQVMLQRALLTRATAPGPVNPADWVAARGAALAAMGAGADAHRLVSRVAIDRYTERLYAVAAQAALASADPMALCPLSPTARAVLRTPTWVLSDAMCLSILGDEVGASVLFDRMRSRNAANSFDIGLAERLSSAAGGGRRGANPEWAEAGGRLTAWRIGLSAAAGLELPQDLVDGAGPAQKAWMVRLPTLSIGRRAALAPEVAATGAISAAEIARILAAEVETLESSTAGGSPGGQLRRAAVAPDMKDRLAALKALWSRARPGTPGHYGLQAAAASVAQAIPASGGLAADAPAIVASLNAAGYSSSALRWWPAMDDADEDLRATVWAHVVALSDAVPLDQGLYDSWSGRVSAHRAALLAAGLAGLGRAGLEATYPALENDWTRALDRAVSAGRAGEVMVLAATGLKGSWAEVAPDHLRRIVAALAATGHADEARHIVAEAANRG